MDAKSNAFQRKQALDALNSAEATGTNRVISNVRLFSEGVDVPALSSIAFLNARDSITDIIQAIGRVMRKPAGESAKKYGYIIAPFYLARGESVAEALEKKSPRFATLGKVLRALLSHDETLKDNLQEALQVGVVALKKKGPNDAQEEEGDYDSTKQLSLYWHQLEGIHPEIANYCGLGHRGKWLAERIISAVQRAAKIFEEEGVAKTLAISLGKSESLLESLNSDEAEGAKWKQDACSTSSLLLINACLMHKRLEATGKCEGEGIANLDKLTGKQEVLPVLIDSWQVILKRDYKPIFEQAVRILNDLQKEHSDIKNLNRALRHLINCAYEMAEDLNELGYDHAGPLYHKILEHAASQGAFYTKNISALLLSKLAFNKTFTDWKDADKVQELKVLDPSCGTGTLLMATLNTFKQRVIAAGSLSRAEPGNLHKNLVENCIHGFDITPYAVQLAACNMTLGDPNVSYKKMWLYTLPYGQKSGRDEVKAHNVRQGSLELLLQEGSASDNGQHNMQEFLQKSAQGSGLEGGTASLGEISNSYDAVIMNPPYTDTSKQKGQFPLAVGEAMSERLQIIAGHLTKNAPEEAAALAKMSIRPFFSPLADRLVHPARGTLAKFMPATACTAMGGIKERQFLAKRFHIETIITTHDPKDIAFSASTSIHESILIARRDTDKNKPTRFVQLAHMPQTVEEVEVLTNAIEKSEMGDWGNIIHWPAPKVQAGDWSPVLWYSTDLLNAIQQIQQLKGLAPYRSETYYPVLGQSFRGMFDYLATSENEANHNKAMLQGFGAYCSIKEEYRKTMHSSPDSLAVPKQGKEEQAKRLLSKGGHVLIPGRFSTTSGRVMALYTEEPSIGSAYLPMDSSDAMDRNTAKAFTVFLNSSFGLLQFLNIRTKKLTYPQFEMGSLKTLRFPVESPDLSPLVKVFNKTAQEELLRLNKANEDPVRKKLDYVVAKLLGVEPAETDKWRTLLALEPTISNKPATNRPKIKQAEEDSRRSA